MSEQGMSGAGGDGAAVEIELEEVAPAAIRASTSSEGTLTRPSLRLGRQLSLKRKKHVNISTAPPEEGAFQRNVVTHRSLPPQRRSGSHVQDVDDAPVQIRRASSFTHMPNRYEQWEDLTVNFGDLRQSSRPLEDRIARR